MLNGAKGIRSDMQISLHKTIQRFQKDGMSLCIIKKNRKGQKAEWG